MEEFYCFRCGNVYLSGVFLLTKPTHRRVSHTPGARVCSPCQCSSGVRDINDVRVMRGMIVKILFLFYKKKKQTETETKFEHYHNTIIF